jgi:hypothetical protein
MARSLTLQRLTIPRNEREKYLQKLKVRRDHYKASNCRFWVFEERSLPGAFIEFTEADDDAVLAGAHASAPQRILDPARIYQEVDF